MKSNRRRFLKNTGFVAGTVLISGPDMMAATQFTDQRNVIDDSGETLYNGIKLPKQWPRRYMKPNAYDPPPVPYLELPPDVILIDIGRQLFVDDFLIEYTNSKHVFHQPTKHIDNPILKPETNGEKNKGFCPVAAPFSDGCFYDPGDKLFKLWYMAGWFDGTALATSIDGIHWERPKFDVVPGTNLVLAPKDNLRRDGVSVWIDHEAKEPSERYKMYLYNRQGEIGSKLKDAGAVLLSSPDGIHWKEMERISNTSDNNTFFYNPFRKKWVFTIRKGGRPIPPWANPLSNASGRARSYWESDAFKAPLTNWDGAIFWFGADRLDPKRADYSIGEEPQIYKVDAAGYESLIIGLIQLHYGPSNEVCAASGIPKLTELQIAFSRDGFHWDRSCRETFIAAEVGKKESWERGYVHSVGGVCAIVGDHLHFYYAAFKGNESNLNPLVNWNGLYANASTGLAILRRDGFASMEAGKDERILLTRKIKFSGSHLFVNIDAPKGTLFVEICNEDGNPVAGFAKKNCISVSEDTTKTLITWTENKTLTELSGKIVRIRFYLKNAKLYSFWVSKDIHGASSGATAVGGPGLNGYWDV